MPRFGLKCGSTKRKKMCLLKTAANKKSNAKTNAETSAAKKRKAIEYEQETLGDVVDLSDAAQETASQKCIEEIKQRLYQHDVAYPNGYMLAIYGASTGSFTVEYEGKMQFSGRGYSIPPIVDANGKVISLGLQGGHGPGGESVHDCGSSKVLSKVVETAAQEHFTPICDAPESKMPRTWKVIGAGGPKGTGPYHICIRIMPMPLPEGWHRSFCV
jgi:hypothetical protein